MQESFGISYGNRQVVSIPKELQNLTLEELIEKKVVQEQEIFCEKHSGTYTAKPFLKTIFGSVIFTECPKCKEDRDKERATESEKRREAILREKHKHRISILKARGCGNKYLNMRENLSKETQLLSKGLAKYLENDGLDFFEKDRLIVLGGCGIGKTFFGNMLVEIAYDMGLKYVCYNAFEMAGIYKSTNINGFNRTNSFENLVEILDGVDCLIIDEIDYFLRGSKDIRDDEALHHVSQICEKEDIRMIILGNCNRNELKDGLPPKVFSRLTGGKVINGWNMEDLRVKR